MYQLMKVQKCEIYFFGKKTLVKLLIVANWGNKDLLLRNLANVACLFCYMYRLRRLNSRDQFHYSF